jgi:carboxypeptidase D
MLGESRLVMCITIKLTMYRHIEVSPEHNGNLFFWHYKNRHIANKQRTVIWLNGGPGCSSMDGALMEIGPYRLKDDQHLIYNEGSWDEFTNLLFVDNPVGTGFSYVDTNSYLHELPEMADQFIIFLEKWFAIFPEYEHDDVSISGPSLAPPPLTFDQIYLAGESYAGQHIPYIAQAVIDRNTQARGQNKIEWNMKGLLIGNGWIAPSEQYQSYLPFAYAEGLVQGGSDQANRLEAQQSRCLADLNTPGGTDHVDVAQCETVLTMMLELTQRNNKCYNMYDVRLFDDYPSCGMAWPSDLSNVTPYLRRDDVVKALHISRDKRTGWTECAGAVSGAFRARHSKPSIRLLPGLLEAGLPILLFSGDKDLICNHLGTEDLIHNMAWSGGTGFELSPGVWAPKRDWTFEDEPAGIYQEARNLTYVLLYNSSHMVPYDYPRRTRDMLDRFIGVDIASIGGSPADSRIDGEKAGLETSVGGHPNSTAGEADEKQKLKDAEWKAYYKSGEAALVVVVIAAAIWGWFVWRGRRRQKGYSSVPMGNGQAGLEGFRMKQGNRDVEAADFDENEMAELQSRPTPNGSARDLDAEQYSLGSDSEDGKDEQGPEKGKGRAEVLD